VCTGIDLSSGIDQNDRVDREEFEYQVRSRQTKKDDDQFVVWIQHDEPNEGEE